MRSTPWLLALVIASCAAGPALAQIPLNESSIRSGAPKAPGPGPKGEPPPAAVPGARSRTGSAAPAERSAADLPPTEALFDAINRGDIVTARDAISRGADLDGTNLLGLTPLELSVDLGRNDLSFLLLSLRGGGGSSSLRSGPPVQETEAAPSPAQRRKAEAEARAQARAQALAARQQAIPAAPPQRRPALFAGNGGTAVPSAGFLGFDPPK